MHDLGKWAAYLVDAEARREAVNPITDLEPELSADDAYQIQALVVEAKVAAGEFIVGAKLGLTSIAKQIAMRVEQPVYGVLMSGMALEVEHPLDCSKLIHPRVEPEIVFVLGDDLTGPGITGHDVLDATRYLTCGLEVIDSRYSDFRFTYADVVADNTSASRFVLGAQRVRPSDITDLALIGCNLQTNSRVVASAAGAAILGHPASAVALLANWLGAQGGCLRRGTIVLSGGMTNAVPIRPGVCVSASFAQLGTVTLRGV